MLKWHLNLEINLDTNYKRISDLDKFYFLSKKKVQKLSILLIVHQIIAIVIASLI